VRVYCVRNRGGIVARHGAVPPLRKEWRHRAPLLRDEQRLVAQAARGVSQQRVFTIDDRLQFVEQAEQFAAHQAIVGVHVRCRIRRLDGEGLVKEHALVAQRMRQRRTDPAIEEAVDMDHVERARLNRHFGHIHDLRDDGQPMLLRERAQLADSDRRDVPRHHLQSVPGKVNRRGAKPAGKIKRPPAPRQQMGVLGQHMGT
jgi:hypothetical protein